jgi:hypothetical protein
MKKDIKLMIKLFVLLVLVAGFIGSAVSGIWTLLPESTASKESMLGYKSHCTFTPISTMILIFMAVVFSYILIRTKFLKFFNN